MCRANYTERRPRRIGAVRRGAEITIDVQAPGLCAEARWAGIHVHEAGIGIAKAFRAIAPFAGARSTQVESNPGGPGAAARAEPAGGMGEPGAWVLSACPLASADPVAGMRGGGTTRLGRPVS
jgi:hypothetical protein